ncbi:MAG TPA: PASTA domain-containing protein [Thermoanaerobaculia bacterium]|jgi:hypothetical protein
MPSDLIRFPGDLITADLWNKMLSLIDGVSARIDAQEARVVPDVVGDLFPTALGEIAVAQLDLSTVFDVEGTRGTPGDKALDTRIVVSQSPYANAAVPAGTRVSLVITAPKVVKANAPTITGVKPANAQIGQALDITGTNFTGNVRVAIRAAQLDPSQFTVQSATQIHIAKFPPFSGGPDPGTSVPLPLTVGNDAGNSDNFTVTFVAPALPAKPISITNVNLADNGHLRISGTNLVQSGQDIAVTMGGEDRVPFVEGSTIVIPLPTAMAKAFQAVTPQLFAILSTIDKNDVLKVNITSGGLVFDPGVLTKQPIASPSPSPLTREAGVSDLGLIARPGFLGTTTTMKLYVIMPIVTAGKIQNSKPVVSGNTVFFPGPTDAPIFSVDVATLTDVTIALKVGDKSTAFVVKFGSIPDKPSGPFLGGFAIGGVSRNF